VPHWFALLQPWFYSFSKKRNQFSFRFGFSGIDNHCYYSKSTLTFTVTYFVFQYKPIESVSDNCYLHVQWLFSLQRRKNVSNWYSIANEWLPAHKIQILAIDDGKMIHGTGWTSQEKNLVTVCSCSTTRKQRRKRHALYRGFN
jgi:hypothetical protein